MPAWQRGFLICLLGLMVLCIPAGAEVQGRAATPSDTAARTSAVLSVLHTPGGEMGDLVPVRALVAGLGGTVEWDGQAGRLEALLQDGRLELVNGRGLARHGEKEYVLYKPPRAFPDGLYLTPRDAAGLFGRQVVPEGEETVLLPAAGGIQGLSWVEVRSYSEGPAWYLIGRVHNEGELAAELTRVTWEVGDAGGKVLDTAAGYINFLNPGEAKAFKLVLPLRGDASWYRVSLTPGFPAAPRRLALAADAQRGSDRPAAYLSLLGEVTNQGEAVYDFLKVVVEFYDRSGRLVDVDSAFLTYLDPHQTRTFTVYTPRHEQAAKWAIKFD